MGGLAILCAGQGAQHAGMFDLLRENIEAEKQLQQWLPTRLLEKSVHDVLADQRLITSNRLAQPLIVAATLSVWEALKPLAPKPVLVAGYSVGEIAAHAVAGTMTATSAIELVTERAALMDDCVSPTLPHAMLSVSAVTESLIENLAGKNGCFIAIKQGDEAFIVGGLHSQIETLHEQVLQHGGRAVSLAVRVASHTPLMQSCVAPFLEALTRCNFADPQLPVLSGISGELVRRREHAVTALSRQLVETIQWMDCMDTCAEAGVKTALEIGPGRALSRMLQAHHPHIQCRSVDDFQTLQGVARWLQRVE